MHYLIVLTNLWCQVVTADINSTEGKTTHKEGYSRSQNIRGGAKWAHRSNLSQDSFHSTLLPCWINPLPEHRSQQCGKGNTKESPPPPQTAIRFNWKKWWVSLSCSLNCRPISSSISSPVLLGKEVICYQVQTSLDSIPALPLIPREVLHKVSCSKLCLGSLIFKLKTNTNPQG